LLSSREIPHQPGVDGLFGNPVPLSPCLGRKQIGSRLGEALGDSGPEDPVGPVDRLPDPTPEGLGPLPILLTHGVVPTVSRCPRGFPRPSGSSCRSSGRASLQWRFST